MSAQPVVIAESSESSLSESEARRLVEKIRRVEMEILDQVQSMAGYISDLYEGRGWLSLGYSSWEECCQAEFSQVALWQSVEQRIERTLALRSSKMSLVAIATALGTSKTTVHRDLREGLSTVPNGTVDNGGVEVLHVQGVDGRNRGNHMPSEEAIEDRRARVSDLYHKQGKTQEEIARSEGVSQGTISSDLAATSQLRSSSQALDMMAKIPESAESLQVELARAALRDLQVALSTLTEHVIEHDDWVSETKGISLHREIVPALSENLLVLTRSLVLANVAGTDLPEHTKLAWTRNLDLVREGLNVSLSPRVSEHVEWINAALDAYFEEDDEDRE